MSKVSVGSRLGWVSEALAASLVFWLGLLQAMKDIAVPEPNFGCIASTCLIGVAAVPLLIYQVKPAT